MALNPVLTVWTLTTNLMLPGEFALAFFLQIYTAIQFSTSIGFVQRLSEGRIGVHLFFRSTGSCDKAH